MTRISYFLLLLYLPMMSVAQDRLNDSLALVSLYNSTNGPEWTIDSNWLDTPIDQWHGIFTVDDRVHTIELSDNNLSGPLPSEIGNLTALSSLRMSSNEITGAIPPEIGACRELQQISLFVNRITSLPAELANCSKLDDIRIYRNEIEGPFPSFFTQMTQLVRLNIGSNKLSGPLPVGMDSLVNLRVLSIERNELTGQLLSMKVMPDLVEVHVDENEFTGHLDDILPDSSNLYYFTCSQNRITGCMKSSYFKPDQLQFLQFSNNAIDCVGDFSVHREEGVLDRIWCERNYLDFDDLIPLADLELIQFTYAPQNLLGTSDTLYREAGEPFSFKFEPGGTDVSYQWSRNGVDLLGATLQTYQSFSFDPQNDEGRYQCKAVVDHPMLVGLILTSQSDYLFEGTSTSLHDPDLASISIAPNPCSSYIELSQLPQNASHVIVTNVMGQQVHQATVNGGENGVSCDISNLVNGTYLVLIKDTEAQVTAIGRFVKAN